MNATGPDHVADDGKVITGIVHHVVRTPDDTE